MVIMITHQSSLEHTRSHEAGQGKHETVTQCPDQLKTILSLGVYVDWAWHYCSQTCCTLWLIGRPRLSHSRAKYSFPDYTLLHYHSMGGASFCINLCGMPFLLDNEEAGPMYELWLYNRAEQPALHYCMQRHKSKSAQLNRFLKGINMK